MRFVALAVLFFAVACGSSPTGLSHPTASGQLPASPALFIASGVTADQEEHTFNAPKSSWTLDWSYTCPPNAPGFTCYLIVAVYGPDLKLADEIMPDPTVSTGSGTQVETIGPGNLYVLVTAIKTTSWSMKAHST